jgi:AsmA protein
VSFDLHIDQLDLDRYRGAPAATSHVAQAAAPAAATAPIRLPTAMLRTLRMQGSLVIDTFRLAGLTVSQLSLKASARSGMTQLAPIGAQLYGGSYEGALMLDAQGPLPVLNVQQTLQHIDMARLLRDFAGTQRLSGSARMTAMLSAQGADSAALMRSLGGRVVLDVDHGAIQGMDLPFEAQRAAALLKRATPPPSARSSGQTAFQTLHASALLHGGVAETHDLNIATQLLSVRGQGSLNLINDAVNSQLQVTLLKEPASPGASAATVAQIPIDVTGTLASLQVRPDLSQLARSQLQQQLQQQLERHQGQLPPQVQGVLKGLFGGARAH